jgi:hypothetical protein
VHGFSFYFTPLTGVLFTFRSRYFYAIGHQVVLSLAGWSPRIHARFHETGATREVCRRHTHFAYEAVTLYGPTFQEVWLCVCLVTPLRVRDTACSSHDPDHATLTGLHMAGLGYSHFARRY